MVSREAACVNPGSQGGTWRCLPGSIWLRVLPRGIDPEILPIQGEVRDMTNKPNLNELSIEQLEALIEQATDLIEEKRAEALRQAQAEVLRIASGMGMTIEQLMGLQGAKPAKKATKKVGEKYRNPGDPAQTWSGRGKRPKWLQVALDNGAKLEEFEA